MFSICEAKYALSSSRKAFLRVLRVEINSSKYFSDLWSTASAFSSSVSLAWRISRRTDYVFSNFKEPSLAALLILVLRSLAPSSILETRWPRWASNMRQDGQIILNGGVLTSSIACSSTRIPCCAGYTPRCRSAPPLSALRPSAVILSINYIQSSHTHHKLKLIKCSIKTAFLRKALFPSWPFLSSNWPRPWLRPISCDTRREFLFRLRTKVGSFWINPCPTFSSSSSQ